ncbi:Acetylene hydratase [Pelotomaculum sp. FP]|uniref:molybdopterin-containing oxidoreductase family protein n=1 Tax=Pelotomaculum sp. FP TaxID=261474 RepID=UPI001066BE04|nr:molybdopterin-dependent oxidoreductase [Pelotomaculum sp. FP]TEB14200.1 Acetylene hydratase [Pelotomaculum sp. FP]
MCKLSNPRALSGDTAELQTLRTVCGICGSCCGMTLTLQNGSVIAVDGDPADPYSQGNLCFKGRAIIDLLNAPDRLRYPLSKTRNGKWQKLSWEEAFDLLSERLKTIKNRYGPQALAVHVGQAGAGKEFTHYVERFCNIYGTPNFSTLGSHSKRLAHILTYGAIPVSDYRNSSCILLWGYNPTRACPPLSKQVSEVHRRGAYLIVVDPITTPLAKTADFHLQLRPGTDGALALGMLHVVIREKLYNKDFVKRWTTGFDQLCDLIKEYPPERVSEITWVSVAKITLAARLYAGSAPSCVTTGIATELQANGFQTNRAIAILQAITGNLDISGGAIFPPVAKLSPLSADNQSLDKKPAVGEYTYPLFKKYTNQAQANLYTRSILEGKPYPIKGMVVTGSDPVLTWPNTGEVRKALGNLEFLAVMDHFMTETAQLGDLVLPAATFLSRNEIWRILISNDGPRLGLAPKVLSEEGLLTDWQFWNILAKKMGYGRDFPWLTEEQALNYRLKPTGLTLEELKDKPEGVKYAEWAEKSYERKGFDTPSGKVEIYSKVLQDHGYEPLPNYREPIESPLSLTCLAEIYPLVLTTGARNDAYHCFRCQNLPVSHMQNQEPMVEVHREKAKELYLQDGETVVVASPRGRIELKVKYTDKIDPRVISIPHVWEKANANELTDNIILDPVTGLPPDRSMLARIIKKE